MANTTKNKKDPATQRTVGGTTSAAGTGQGKVKAQRDDATGSANQSPATLKDKIFGAVKKVTGRA